MPMEEFNMLNRIAWYTRTSEREQRLAAARELEAYAADLQRLADEVQQLADELREAAG